MAGSGRHRADESLIASLAAGASIKEAAAQAGVGERTAFRRLNDPRFRQRLAETKGRMLEADAVRRLMAEQAGSPEKSHGGSHAVR